MRNAPVLLLLLASTGAVAADPPKPDCPAPQAETVHLYLKANGTKTPVTKGDGACSSWVSAQTSRVAAGGKDCTGPRGGPGSSRAAVTADGACVTSTPADSARTASGGKDCTGPRGGVTGSTASPSGPTAKHAIRTKGTGASGRAAAPCPSPAGSAAPGK